MRGLCMCILPGKAVPDMTFTVLGGTLNPTHSLAEQWNNLSFLCATHSSVCLKNCWMLVLCFCFFVLCMIKSNQPSAIMLLFLGLIPLQKDYVLPESERSLTMAVLSFLWVWLLLVWVFVCHVCRLGVEPNCYVSYQTTSEPWTCTEIVADSNDPVWCHENDCRLSNELLNSENSVGCFVFNAIAKPVWQ